MKFPKLPSITGTKQRLFFSSVSLGPNKGPSWSTRINNFTFFQIFILNFFLATTKETNQIQSNKNSIVTMEEVPVELQDSRQIQSNKN